MALFQEYNTDQKIEYLQHKLNKLRFRHIKHKLQVIVEMTEQPKAEVKAIPIISPEEIVKQMELLDLAAKKAKNYLDVNKDGKVDKHDFIILIKNWAKVFLIIIGIEFTLIWSNPEIVDFSNPGFAMAQILLAGVTALISFIRADANKKIDGTEIENKSLKDENENLLNEKKEMIASQKLKDIEIEHKHNMEIINLQSQIDSLNCKLAEKQTPIIVNPLQYGPIVYNKTDTQPDTVTVSMTSDTK